MSKTPDILDSADYVSRGGQKLAKAFDFFDISSENKICIDCGASTGGFTDCLLQKGAKKVYAIDVGYGQLAWTLRNDPRVITMERTNIRYVTPDMLKAYLPGASASMQEPELAVIDVSFISLALVLPVVRKLLAEESEVIALIKPQFEAGKGKVGKKGVVKDPEIHKEVLTAFVQNAESAGFFVKGLTYSPVKGPKGNIEYLGWLNTKDEEVSIDIERTVKSAHKELLDG